MSRISPTARNSWRSSRRPVRRAPRIAPGTDVAAPTASNVQSTASGQVAEDARSPKTKTDGRVCPHCAKRVSPADAQKRREPQRAEDQADEAAEQPDQSSRDDRRSCADTSRAGLLRTGLRAKQSTPKTSSVMPIATRSVFSGTTPDRRPPTTAPTIDGGAIQRKRRQSIRPARMWETAEANAATAETPMFAPAPAAGLEAASTSTGSRMFPRTRPTRPPANAVRKHQRPTATRRRASKRLNIPHD